MKDSTKQLVIDWLKRNCSADIDFNYHLKGEDFDDANDIERILDDAGAFNVEIIYYSNAINYLAENDSSLKRSLEIAHELGYTTENLSSELLASLLASQNCREEFTDCMSKLNDYIEEVRAIEDAEEDEEETE